MGRSCLVLGAFILVPVFQPQGVKGVLIADFSFEGITITNRSPTFISLSTRTNVMGSWKSELAGNVSLGANVAAAQGLGGRSSADGSFHVALTVPAGVGASASIDQVLGTPFQPNMRYTLSASLDQGALLTVASLATLRLRAGNTTVASLTGAQLVTLLDHTDGWQTVSLVYETGAVAPAGNIAVRLEMGALVSLGGTLFADNFQLVATPIPEPGTVTLIAVGTAVVRVACRRSKEDKGAEKILTSLSG